MVAFVSDDPNVKMSVNEFNANAEVKELSRVVHSYLNENLAPGTGFLGIKETDKEMISKPSESIRDEIGSLSTFAARAAAIRNAPESVKRSYAKLLDIWNNKTEIKGIGEGLEATKDYAIDILTSPETFLTLGNIAGTTAARTALRSSIAGGAFGGIQNFVEQARDVEIDKIEDISIPEVIGSTAFGAGLSAPIGYAGHKFSDFIKTRDPKKVTETEALELEAKTAVDERIAISSNDPTKPDIQESEVDAIRDRYLEATREKRLRESIGEGQDKDFVRIQADPRATPEDGPLLFGAAQTNITDTTEDIIQGRPSRDLSLPPEVIEFNKKHGGAGTRSNQELDDIIKGTFTELEGRTTQQINNALTYNLSRFANRYGSWAIFKPSSVLDPFTKGSDLAKSLQQKFRYDAQRSFTGPREYDKQDFGEVFKETLGGYYVNFKDALHPIQNSISGKLEQSMNDLVVRGIRDGVDLSESTTATKVMSDITSLLDTVGDRLVSSGVIRNKNEANYFPRLWKREAIKNNREAFERKLINSGEAENAVEATEITNSMLDISNQLDEGASGGASFFYKRAFTKLKDNDFEEFLESDLNSVMLNYLSQTSKQIAKREVFGVSNADEFINFYVEGIAKQTAKAGKTLTKKDRQSILNVYRHATGEGLDSFGSAQGLVDTYSTLNRMAYLPLATISSLTEILINVAKAGPTSSIKALGSALSESRKTIQDQTVDNLKQLTGKRSGLTERESWRELQEFGMVLDPILMDTVERLSGSGIRNQKLSKANNVFFRATFLDQWTKFVQLASYKSGKDLITNNLKEINKVKGVSDSNRIRNMKEQLKELNVDIDEGLKWVDSGESIDDSFYKNVKRGAARYTNEVILNPTNESGLKPFLQAAPRTAILTQFLGYPVAFTNTVLKNAAKDMIRNPTQNAPKILAAGLMMTEMARWTNWARTRGESEKYKSTGEIYFDAVQRWGGNGIVFDMMQRGSEAAKVYQDPVAGYASVLGPVGNDIFKLMRTGNLVRLMGEKIPGYGALGTLAPELKADYTEALSDANKLYKEKALELMGAEDKAEPLRPSYAEGGSVGPTVKNVSNVAEEPQERINPYTGEPYDVTAGSFNMDVEDRNNREDPLRRLGFSNGGKADPSMLRVDGSEKSPRGFLGPIKNNVTGGIMTEVSVDLDIGGQRIQVPTLVPTLTKKEIEILSNMKLEGNAKNIPRSIIDKAAAHAKERIAQNKNPFYVDGEEQRLNKVVGGAARVGNIVRGVVQSPLKNLLETRSEAYPNYKNLVAAESEKELTRLAQSPVGIPRVVEEVLRKKTPQRLREVLETEFSPTEKLALEKILKKVPMVGPGKVKTMSKEEHTKYSLVKRPIYRGSSTGLNTSFDFRFSNPLEIGPHFGSSIQAQHIINHDSVQKAKYLKMIGKNDYITPNSLAADKQDKKGKFAYVVESYDEPVSMTKGYIDIRSPLIFDQEIATAFDDMRPQWSAINVFKDPEAYEIITQQAMSKVGSNNKSNIKIGDLVNGLNGFNEKIDQFYRYFEKAVKANRSKIGKVFNVEIHEANLNLEFTKMLKQLGFDSIKYRNQVETLAKDRTKKGVITEKEESFILFEPEQYAIAYGEKEV